MVSGGLGSLAVHVLEQPPADERLSLELRSPGPALGQITLESSSGVGSGVPPQQSTRDLQVEPSGLSFGMALSLNGAPGLGAGVSSLDVREDSASKTVLAQRLCPWSGR